MIEPETAWKFLLYNNREDLLIAWINIYYNKFQSTDDINHLTQNISTICNMPSEIQRLFTVWDITQRMIDTINDVNCMTKTKEILLDHLSR